jgi:hypothetical protein
MAIFRKGQHNFFGLKKRTVKIFWLIEVGFCVVEASQE